MAIIVTADGLLIDWTDRVKETPSPHYILETDRSGGHRYLTNVAYAEAEALGQFATGYPEFASYVGNSGTTYWYIKRNTPWRLPLKRNRGIFCNRFEWEGQGTPSNFTPNAFNRNLMVDTNADGDRFPFYEIAKCNLNFETPTYDILTDAELASQQQGSGAAHSYDESTWKRYVTILVRPQGELITIQGSTNNGYFAAGVKLNNNAYPINESIHKMVGSKSISITWHQVPVNAIPERTYNPSTLAANTNLAIDWCIGRVNHATFNGFPAGTLLLQSVDIKPCKDSRGDRFFDITYQIKQFQPSETYRAFGNLLRVYPGHNHVFIPKPRLSGATLVNGGAAAPAGWYEMMGDGVQSLAQNATNFGALQKNVSPYDFGNFANLFRPVTYTQDVLP